ncbi:hypothetical protein Dacet_2242 [Denitrovibrio acetiphilus DSM 12809]|uniref:Uncharacterized protein n=1 Tax=Denitrovibrio acetiphilus (strain DSM 12809 / NBRC 114555 / N2460) TaxID=522772 RepID=D4H2Y1_DENA2|nr:hypothetical protein [Denitrovibrio acetiphilus]ADD69004.1 hypothetical protein Dacet_2242 [Denitrovibrio acetiphilus DSM 12809]
MSKSIFSFTAADTGLNSFRFVLESAENSGKTIFAPDERARLKLYPGGTNPHISVTSGKGTIFLSAGKQKYTEYIAFRDSDSGSVTYHIEKLETAVWEGSGRGKPQIYGNRLTLPAKTTGVLKVTYETSYDLIDVTCSRPTYVLVSAETNSLAGDFLLDFTDGYITDVYDKDVVMTVRDACTRETISGASVYINSNSSFAS